MLLTRNTRAWSLLALVVASIGMLWGPFAFLIPHVTGLLGPFVYSFRGAVVLSLECTIAAVTGALVALVGPQPRSLVQTMVKLPSVWGWCAGLVGSIFVLPLRSMFLRAQEPLSLAWLWDTLRVIPEHFLVFGLILAVLSQPSPARKAAPSSRTRRTARAYVPCLVSSLLFGLIHIGKPNLTEVVLSFPGGLVLAMLTWLTRSVWPGILIHAALNWPL